MAEPTTKLIVKQPPVYRCPKCGSFDVQGLAFVRLNVPHGEPDFMVDNPEDTWCKVCNGHEGSEIATPEQIDGIVMSEPDEAVPEDGQLLVRLVALERTSAGRAVRLLLAELRWWQRRATDAARMPPDCTCGAGNGDEHPHTPLCQRSLSTYGNAAEVAIFEFRRVQKLRAMVQALVDNDTNTPAFGKAHNDARGYLSIHDPPTTPGDDRMPF